ncbi:MAG TPA: hypothetical protein EYM86_03555 [Flavobacteriales bacterium]|nr:hypothetical protein [Flavobacteriales bacterium]HIO16801.1 hypothetical protein [Flavobacteriales bacterium]
MKKSVLLKSILPIFGVITLFSVTGCRDKDPGWIKLNTSLNWHGIEMVMGDTVFDKQNRPVRPEKLYCYISDISLRDLDGEWINTSSISRLDFTVSTASALGEINCDVLKKHHEFDAIKFGLGVPSEMNQGVDPASYPNSHPLSVSGSAGMRWDMDNSYFFVKHEGKLAAEAGGVIEIPFALHPATDALYREITFELSQNIIIHSEEIEEVFLELDLGSAIEGTFGDIDLSEVGHSMGEVPIAIMFVDNITDAWTLK